MNTLVEGKSHPRDFTIFPDFFDAREQRVLLSSALQKLDASESRPLRKRKTHSSAESGDSIQRLFMPDEYYRFEEVIFVAARPRQLIYINVFFCRAQGHYDGVIRHFRETHVSSWAENEFSGLPPILRRLESLCPSTDTQTHLLHLGSQGEILPHIDNPEASGSWILGVSLGSERIMRVESLVDGNDNFDVLLQPGSVYLQM